MWGRLGLAALALAALAAAWFLRPHSSKPPPLPVIADKPALVLVPPADASLPVWPPALNTDIAVVEPALPDSGETMEVVLEVFDEKGHLAAQEVELQNPPCPTDGGEAYGVRLTARTNMMGLARIALPAGTWEVENFHSVPPRIEVGYGQNTFVLRKTDVPPALIEGLVVDDLGQPIPQAQVSVQQPASSSNRHARAVGDSLIESDANGRFILRTYESRALLVAQKDSLVSRKTWATANSKSAVLRLFAPAWATFELPCTNGFVQYEHAGEMIDFGVANRGEAMVAAGTRRFRMRCESRGEFLGGATDVELAAGSRVPVSFDVKKLGGPKVRVVDTNGRPLRGVTVVAEKGLTAMTDSNGEAVLNATHLDSFDPLFRVDLQGAWKPRAESRARLGDASIEIVAVPR